MIALTFRLRRDRALTRIGARHPDATLLLWCNLDGDVVQVQGVGAEESDLIAQEFQREHGDVRRLGHPGEPPTLVFRCPHRRVASVTRLVGSHAALLVPPVVSARGWDSFRVLCFDDRRVRGLLEACAAMGELEVVSKRPVERTLAEEHFLVPGAEIVGGLTHRQREALLLALDAGYYEVPRRATVQDIAQRQGRPRTTFEEHLRKAEGKLIRAVAPLVALGAARRFSADARRGPRTRSRAARRTAPSGAPSGARRPRGGRAGG